MIYNFRRIIVGFGIFLSEFWLPDEIHILYWYNIRLLEPQLGELHIFSFIHWFDVDVNNINGTSSVPATSLEKIDGSFIGSNRARSVNDMASGIFEVAKYNVDNNMFFQNSEIRKCITTQF